jgi:hypothetical protein
MNTHILVNGTRQRTQINNAEQAFCLKFSDNPDPASAIRDQGISTPTDHLG